MENTYNRRMDLQEFQNKINTIKSEIHNLIIGQNNMIDLLLTALISDGHVLIEGMPGTAKTLSARILSKIIQADFKRIQFTPDLMPADIIGTSVYNTKIHEFEFKKGPLFSNIVIIDEINRSPAKTQAALFEAMEEQNVTVDGHTYKLSTPFFVIGTQNPIEYEGTYRLPEAQLDRFMFKIIMDYPLIDEEIEILNKYHTNDYNIALEQINPVITVEELIKARNTIKQIHVEPNMLKYIAEIIYETRNNSDIFMGASPRASLSIVWAAKTFAAINGRDFITPEDIKFIVKPVLCHRILPSPEKEMEGITSNHLIDMILKKIEIPR